jgi:hypothetical protein
MTGRQKRRGRPPVWLTATFDMSADEAFKMHYQYIKEAQGQWATLTLDEKGKVIDRITPLALKRIPDKVESTSLVLNISDDDAQAMLAEARRNLLIYKELRAKRGQDAQTLQKGLESEVGLPPPSVTVISPPSHGAQI